MARFTYRHLTVTFLDGAALTMVAPGGPGDVSIDGLEEGNSEAVAVRERGSFVGMIEGDDIEQSFSVTVNVPAQTLTSGAQNRILDVVNKTGAWAAATTVDPFAAKWAVKVQLDFDDGAGNTGQMVLPCARLSASFSESAGEPSTFSISGTNYQIPTRT